LALATYKSKQPDTLAALQKAKSILQALSPRTSSDVETVGLWGAIHKRLWEVATQAEDLAQAIRAYARGYFIRNDYYNGINFAFLLNVRAAQSGGDEAIADRVAARRVRREVLLLCDAALASGTLKADELFWVGATKVEALLGLGLKADSDRLKQHILSGPPPTSDPDVDSTYKQLYAPPAGWMIDTMNDQLGKLAALEP
jgi:MAP3K TRAFs-binding domain